MSWRRPRTPAHDAVVAELAQAGPAIPLRLTTVYLDEERVRRMLRERHAEFDATLRRLSGRTEWGVKAYAEPTAEAAVGQQPAAPTGTAYLQRHKAQLTARDDAARRAEADAQQVHAALAEVAVATQRHRAQDAQLTGTKAAMVLNGAYLVDDARSEEFAARVAAQQTERPAVRLELTGP